MVSNTNDSDARNPRGRPEGTGAATSDAVRLTREALDWTQQQIAGELSCSLSAISKMEQERRLPGQKKLLDRFTALAARAGVDLLACDEQQEEDKE